MKPSFTLVIIPSTGRGYLRLNDVNFGTFPQTLIISVTFNSVEPSFVVKLNITRRESTNYYQFNNSEITTRFIEKSEYLSYDSITYSLSDNSNFKLKLIKGQNVQGISKPNAIFTYAVANS